MTPQKRKIPQRREIFIGRAVLYALVSVFLAAPAFSDGSQQTSARGEGSAEEVRIKPENIEKTLPSYKLSLKKLIDVAEKKISRIDAELKEREIGERNKEREAEARAHFERGNALHAEGKLEEAKAEWQKAVDITRDPQMKGYIRQSEQKAREEERARKREEAERRRQLAAGQREKEREKVHQAEFARVEAERKAREEQRRLEQEQREQRRTEREKRKRLEAESRDRSRSEAGRLAAEEREAERMAGEREE